MTLFLTICAIAGGIAAFAWAAKALWKRYTERKVEIDKIHKNAASLIIRLRKQLGLRKR